MAQAVTPQTRLIILNNPNNPTGTAFFRQEWEEFLAALPANLTVVLDEAYLDFADDPLVPSGLDYLRRRSAPGGAAHLFQGLRPGRPAHRLRLRPQRADRLPEPPRMPFNVNRLAQVAARAALTDTDFLARTRELVLKGKAEIYRELGAWAWASSQPDQFRAHPGAPAGTGSLSGHAAGRGHHPGHGRLRLARLHPGQRGAAGGKPAFLKALQQVLGLNTEWGPGIITIDGPAGAGKSTVAPPLAQSLGYLYLDSGALYRAVAWQAHAAGSGPGPPRDPGRFSGGIRPGSDRRYPGISPGDRRRRGGRGTQVPSGDPGVLPAGGAAPGAPVG